MNSRDRSLFVPLAGLLALSLILGGCKDQAAQQREITQKKITEASATIENATMLQLDPSDPATAEVERTLRGVVGTLKGISQGEPGQMAAKHMLLATALRELAFTSLAQTEEIEARHQHQRAIIVSNIRAARELEAVAAALESLEVQSEQRQLQQVRGIAQTALAQASQQLADLDGPIAQRTTQNAQDNEQAARLNDEAGSLRRESAESGYAAGFPAYERAVALERQADRIEYEISHRRIELDYQLQPEHALAQARADQMNALLKAVESSSGDLDEMARVTADAAAATRRTIGELRQTINADLNRLAQETTGTLDDLYAKADRDLNEAASAAGNAAREAQKVSGGPRGGGDDARVLQARVNELQGGMYWQVARAAAERGMILARLLEAGNLLGDPQALASQLEAANREYEEALASATTAYQSAQGTLANVRSSGGGQSEVEAFKLGVDTALAALTGRAGAGAAPATESSDGLAPDGGSAGPDFEDTTQMGDDNTGTGGPDGDDEPEK